MVEVDFPFWLLVKRYQLTLFCSLSGQSLIPSSPSFRCLGSRLKSFRRGPQKEVPLGQSVDQLFTRVALPLARALFLRLSCIQREVDRECQEPAYSVKEPVNALCDRQCANSHISAGDTGFNALELSIRNLNESALRTDEKGKTSHFALRAS